MSLKVQQQLHPRAKTMTTKVFTLMDRDGISVPVQFTKMADGSYALSVHDATAVGGTAVSGSSSAWSQSAFTATAAGPGYAVGDYLSKVVTTDPTSGDIEAAYWVNITKGTSIDEPASANITATGPTSIVTIYGTPTVNVATLPEVTVKGDAANPVPVSFPATPTVNIGTAPEIVVKGDAANPVPVTVASMPEVTVKGDASNPVPVTVTSMPAINVSSSSAAWSSLDYVVTTAGTGYALSDHVSKLVVSDATSGNVTASYWVNVTQGTHLSAAPNASDITLSSSGSGGGTASSVSITNTPSVNVANTPTVNIGTMPEVTVKGDAANPVPVTVAGTPTVNVGTMPEVVVKGDAASPVPVTVTSMPTVNVTAASIVWNNLDFTATAAATGYAIGDHISKFVVSDASSGSVSATFWVNMTQGTHLASAPASADITAASSGGGTASSVTVTNTPSVTISGTPSVSVTGTPNVAISGTPTVNVGTMPEVTVKGDAASPVPVTVSGTPAVTVSGTATVAEAHPRAITAVDYVASVAGTGFSVGDYLTHVVVTDQAAGTVLNTYWVNATLGTVLGSAPASASIAPRSASSGSSSTVTVNNPTSSPVPVAVTTMPAISVASQGYAWSEAQYTTTVDGTGFAAGDTLSHVVVTDPATGTLIVAYWVNVTQGAKLASAPASASLASGANAVSISNTPTVNIGTIPEVTVKGDAASPVPVSFPTTPTVNIGTAPEIMVKGDSANPVPVTVGNSRVSTSVNFISSAAGTGYASGDYVSHVVTTEPTTGTVIAAYWINITQGAILATAPATASLSLASQTGSQNTNITQWGTGTVASAGMAGVVAVGGAVADGVAPAVNAQLVGGVTPSGLMKSLRLDDAGGISGPGEVLYTGFTFTAGSAVPVEGTSARTYQGLPGRDCELFVGISAQGNAANTIQVEGSWDNVVFSVIPLTRIDTYAAGALCASAAAFTPASGATYKGRTYGYPIIRIHQTALTTTGTTVSEMRLVPLHSAPGESMCAFSLSAVSTIESTGGNSGSVMTGGVKTLYIPVAGQTKFQVIIDAFVYGTAAPTVSTLIVEGTNDNGNNWVTLSGTTGISNNSGVMTAVGALGKPACAVLEGDCSDYDAIRVRWSAYTAGTATNAYYHGGIKLIPVGGARTPGNQPAPAYRIAMQQSAAANTTTYIMAINAGPSKTTRVKRITIWNQGVAATAAGTYTLHVYRTTTAATGGLTYSVYPANKTDPSFTGSAQGNPTTLTTGSGQGDFFAIIPVGTAYVANPPYVIDFTAGGTMKGLEISPGVANGIVVYAVTGSVTGAVSPIIVSFDFTEE